MKNYKNFVITAIGRSGTKFLANTMNLSKKWTVLHEVGYEKDMIPSWDKIIQKRLNQDYYGEVSSQLRFQVRNLRVNKKGVIFRNVEDLVLSNMNWRPERKPSLVIGIIKRGLEELIYLVEHEACFPISFEAMTSDIPYLQWILGIFGIDDVEITPEIISKKININKSYERTLSELSLENIKDLNGLKKLTGSVRFIGGLNG